MNKLNVFVPFDITKTDDEKRMVYGYASTEALDSQGEVVKVEALKEALPDYMKFANVREMHSNKAVGKVKESNINKDGWFVGVKVVADDAWKLVKEEVLNGFSIGGQVLSKVENEITKLKLSEISLVDRPANPEAVFSCVKFEDGKMKKEPIKKDIQGAIETLEVAQAAEAIAVGETVAGEDTKNIDSAVTSLKAHAESELAEPEMHENIPAALRDQGADEEAEEMIEPDEDNEEEVEEVEYADKAKDLKKVGSTLKPQEGKAPADVTPEGDGGSKDGDGAPLQPGMVQCSKCDGSGMVDGNKCDKCDGVGQMKAEKVDKAEQSTDERNSLKDSEFAYVSSKGEKKLPINDKAHVQNAMSRFNQTQFESTDAKATAKSKICSAAKKFGIEGDFCKATKFDIPSDKEIVDKLEKAGVKLTQKNTDAMISKVKNDLVDKQLEAFKVDQIIQSADDEKKAKFITQMKEIVKKLNDELLARSIGGYVKITKLDEAKVEPEKPATESQEGAKTEEQKVEEPVIEAPKEEVVTANEDSEKMEKIEQPILAKLDEVKLSLEKRVDDAVKGIEGRLSEVEKMAAPIKVETFAVNRFEKEVGQNGDLLKKIEETANALKANPMNTELQAKALELQKEYQVSLRK